jgi:hypothetical protein
MSAEEPRGSSGRLLGRFLARGSPLRFDNGSRCVCEGAAADASAPVCLSIYVSLCVFVCLLAISGKRLFVFLLDTS